MPHDRPHPRTSPRIPGELTLEGLKGAFSDCADFFTRTVALGDGEHRVTVCFLLGMARNERLQDYVLKPMMSDPVLAEAKVSELPRLLMEKAVYAQSIKRPNHLDEAVLDLIAGSCAVILPGGLSILGYIHMNNIVIEVEVFDFDIHKASLPHSC